MYGTSWVCIFCGLLVIELGRVSGELHFDSIENKYWNSHFDYTRYQDVRKQSIVETDIFLCESFASEDEKISISWRCLTKVSGVIWKPNKKLFQDQQRLLISITDTLGTLYAIPYRKKKLLSLCTSGSIQVYGELNERGECILPKDFQFIVVNDCLNI